LKVPVARAGWTMVQRSDRSRHYPWMMQVRNDSMTSSQPIFVAAPVARQPLGEPGSRNVRERRLSRRYDVGLAIRVRVLPAGGTPSEWRTGTVLDLSSTGIGFQCRQPLPVNSRVEMVINWPASRNTRHAACLRAWGGVVRSHGNTVAVRMTSSRMCIAKAAAASAANAASAFGVAFKAS
jgi:PilZ domain